MRTDSHVSYSVIFVSYLVSYLVSYFDLHRLQGTLNPSFFKVGVQCEFRRQ